MPLWAIVPGGGTLDFKWQGWSNVGKNQSPQKSLDQSLTPTKSHAEFPSHKKIYSQTMYAAWTGDIVGNNNESSNCFEKTKKTLLNLNQATQK